mgnify:CR=1 FL=1
MRPEWLVDHPVGMDASIDTSHAVGDQRET